MKQKNRISQIKRLLEFFKFLQITVKPQLESEMKSLFLFTIKRLDPVYNAMSKSFTSLYRNLLTIFCCYFSPYERLSGSSDIA